MRVLAEPVDFAQQSDPVGIVSVAGEAAVGESAHSVEAPESWQDYRFFGWYNEENIRQQDENGRALNPCEPIVYQATTLTARYGHVDADSDQDGVPDWFELRFYGHIAVTPDSDSDGDRYNLREEWIRQTDPHQVDEFACRYNEAAAPEMLMHPRDVYLDPATTQRVESSSQFGQLGDYRFSYWTIDGVRQADSLGRALDPVSVAVQDQVAIQAQAHFFKENEDVDGDTVPDWVEYHFMGSLDRLANDDADGDGLPLSWEAGADTHPALPDRIEPGGLTGARSAALSFVSTNDIPLFVRSEPEGLLDATRYVPAGADSQLVAEMVIGEYRFTGWIIDGVPRRALSGQALNPVTVTISREIYAVAQYAHEGADTDADGVPDWFEWYYLGSLAGRDTVDHDGDGYNLAEECIRQTSPHETDPVAYRYLEQTEPTFLRADSQTIVLQPDELSTSSAQFGDCGQWRFTYWTRDGERLADSLGRALDPVSVVFDDQRSCEHVTHFSLIDADADADGVPDWFEQHFLGTLTQPASEDSDQDNLTLKQEAEWDTHPALPDAITQGGLAPARSQSLNFIHADDVLLRQYSAPPGFVDSSAYIRQGTQVQLEASDTYGTYCFVGWMINGSPQRDAKGKAVNPVNLTISDNTTAVVKLVPQTEDSDQDLVPDWFELVHYGSLDHDAQSDTDGDTIHLLEEWIRGTDPQSPDPLQHRYLEAAVPEALFPATETYYPGTTQQILTSARFGDVAGLRFAYWSLNGVRSADGLGRALDPALVDFTASVAVDAVAHFLPPDLDEDQDGIPDWFEWHFMGNLDALPSQDTDHDGLTLAAEVGADTHPFLPDVLLPGGFAPARTQTLSFAYRNYFLPVNTIFVNGQRSDFFQSTLAHEPTPYSIAFPTAPALGDVDGDGDFDLFVGGPEGALQIYENAGSPVTPNLIPVETPAGLTVTLGDNRLYPAIGDWNGDGRGDLALAGGNLICLYTSGEEVGDVTLVQELLITQETADVVIPEFMDVDSDGDQDLIVLLPTGEIRAYFNSGGSLPFEAGDYSEPLLGESVPEATGVSAVDLDGDGNVDILVADNSGRIWDFRGQNDGTFSLRSKVWGSTFGGFANGLTIAARDWDGDGDTDLIGGSSSGGLVFMINPESHLAVAPPLQTVQANEQIPFSVAGGEELAWSLARNGSGATVDPANGLYQAGSQPGVDCVEVVDAGGATGRAWVNVISSSEASAAGKALIVAGRRSDADPVWSAIRYMGNQAYASLRQRGLAPESIAYFSHASSDSGVDGLPSRQSIQDILSGNALVGPTDPSLTIFLVDHGQLSGSDGTFIINEHEHVSGTELNLWLDQFQTLHPACQVTVVIDCCFAGDMAAALSTSHSDRRTVVAATSPGELTHFLADGRISLSQSFWSNIATGISVAQAFADAAQSMSRFQQAGISDPANLAVAAIGPDHIIGIDRPQIGQVTPDVVLDDTTSTTIWASDISGAFPVSRVWAMIIPPGYQSMGLEPVLDLPRIDLIWNNATRRWEAECDGFVSEGDAAYTVMIYAEDIWGGISYPRQTIVTPAGSRDKVLIVNAAASDDPAWTAARRLSQYAYATCLKQRLDAEALRILSPDSSQPGFAAAPTLAALEESLLTWAPSTAGLRTLTMYLVGKGTATGLALPDGDILTPALLDGWLDTLESQYAIRPTVIVEADYSGIFLSPLGTGSSGRVIMNSCSPDQTAFLAGGGWASFGHWFWSSIARGDSVREAFANAQAVGRALGQSMTCALDDTGDGFYSNKQDGYLADHRFIGTAFVTGDNRPVIGRVSPSQTVSPGTEVSIWATDISTPDGAKPERVWAEVMKTVQGNQAPELIATLDLTWDLLFQSYLGVLPAPLEAGTYTVHILAGSPDATISEPAIITLTCLDGSASTTTGTALDPAIPLLSTQGEVESGFTSPDTAIRYRFLAEPGQILHLDLFPVSDLDDLALDIFNAEGVSVITIDDWGAGLPEMIRYWQPDQFGWYLLLIRPGSNLASAEFELLATLLDQAGPDVYENDDTPARARPVSMAPGHSQDHTFHAADDQDWVVFTAEAGQTYRIDITAEGTFCDAEATLFTNSGQDVVTTFIPEPGQAKQFDWVCPQTGQYWLRITNRHDTSQSAFSGYTLSLFRTTGDIPGFIYGTVQDASGSPLPGQLTLSNGITMQILSNGLYFLCLSAGPYTMTITPADRNPVTTNFTIQPDQILEYHVIAADPPSRTATMALQSGWNLISVPVNPDSPDPQTAFASVDMAGTPLWQWNAQSKTYEAVTQLEPKRGYWLYAVSPANVSITGQPCPVSTACLQQKWNLVGPLADCPIPQNTSMQGNPIAWQNGRYKQETQCLQTTQGYWIYMAQPQILCLQPD